MMRLDDVANKILIAAYNEAKHQKHEFFTPEHILYASLFFDEGRDIIENCGGKVEDIKKDLLEFFRNNMPIVENHEPIESLGSTVSCRPLRISALPQAENIYA